ncbi:hypothetical protein J4Q44_G00035880 [Coregonus suidteri]|uniref:Uncharacterized protein n=1 Tax=Coregonus suidteri TaxID=861788 RepID=A0AAN8MIE5_9TELE
MKSIFSLCTGFSFHWFSKASTLFEMLGTSTVLELKGISHHSNSGEVTESKALRRILLRFLKNMGSIGTDLTAFIEALCQSPRFSWPDYSVEGMSESLLTFLQHPREFGLVFQRNDQRASCHAQTGVLYNQFLSQADSEVLRDRAQNLGCLVWQNVGELVHTEGA